MLRKTTTTSALIGQFNISPDDGYIEQSNSSSDSGDDGEYCPTSVKGSRLDPLLRKLKLTRDDLDIALMGAITNFRKICSSGSTNTKKLQETSNGYLKYVVFIKPGENIRNNLRHRLIYDALQSAIPHEIHALKIKITKPV